MYAEVVPRELTRGAEAGLAQETAWYVDAAGDLDLARLLAAFQAFFREHSEHWVERFAYKEAGPQLLLQAFLQRIVNGGGRIEREYGLGRRRTDLLVFWPARGGCGSAAVVPVTTEADPLSGFFMAPAAVWRERAPRLSVRGFKILLDLLLTPLSRDLRTKELPYMRSGPGSTGAASSAGRRRGISFCFSRTRRSAAGRAG